jgi:hypothetical protein
MEIDKDKLMWGIIVVLILVLAFLVLTGNDSGVSGAVVSETVKTTSSASSYSGMVGGC